ncbi:MAG TPA: PQQ-binding-like beta-propeller repeat protein [Bryobacteraceae bacterium]|nr:PQQ-binding-like beta-propeller repeat protein [Bryobacteraceae bacterium]
MKPKLEIVACAAALCMAAGLGWVSAARAQAPAAQARDKSGRGSKEGTQQIGMETGLTYFQTRCMSCHRENDSTKAPSARRIRQMTPEEIYAVVSQPSRPEHDQGLTDAQKRRMSEFMGGYRQIGSVEAGNPKNFPNACRSNPPMSDPYAGAFWSGWGADIENTRYQRAEAAGITKADVAKLKLKWAFGFPLGISAYSPPAVASGRVFVGTDIGWVYSLDAKTGCYYWGYETGVTVRPAISIGPVSGQGNTKYAIFFGDAKANVYALDAQDGRLLWKRKVEDFFLARITAAPKLYNGRLYVPVSSSEEWQSGNPDYECCTSRGSVVALNANNGEQIWKTYMMDDPKPTQKNPNGVQLYAPAGGSVWNSPTVDPVRHAVYFGTGDTQTEPAQPLGDAIVAVDMDSGKILWHYQAQANDAFMGGCAGANKSKACPKVMGPDADIGNSPILSTTPDGRRVLIAGTKGGEAFALDPDNQGALLWRVAANAGGGRGGIVWGGAADHENVYYGMGSGGMAALKMATGERVWFQPINAGGGRIGNNAAATMIPGVVFVGGTDGKLHALSAKDGSILWQFDTNRNFETVNGVAGAHGGAISSVGPVIAGGMMYIGSGYGVGGGPFGNVLLAFGTE